MDTGAVVFAGIHCEQRYSIGSSFMLFNKSPLAIAIRESKKRGLCISDNYCTNKYQDEMLTRFVIEICGENFKFSSCKEILDKKCLKISLFLFYYLFKKKVFSYYTLGWVEYNHNEHYRFTLDDFDSAMHRSYTPENHVHGWVTLKDGYIIDLTFLTTLGECGRNDSILVIRDYPAILKSRKIDYHHMIVTTTPLDLLQKLGFSVFDDWRPR